MECHLLDMCCRICVGFSFFFFNVAVFDLRRPTYWVTPKGPQPPPKKTRPGKERQRKERRRKKREGNEGKGKGLLKTLQKGRFEPRGRVETKPVGQGV